jgi:hypothetical protein
MKKAISIHSVHFFSYFLFVGSPGFFLVFLPHIFSMIKEKSASSFLCLKEQSLIYNSVVNECGRFILIKVILLLPSLISWLFIKVKKISRKSNFESIFLILFNFLHFSKLGSYYKFFPRKKFIEREIIAP